MDAQGSRSRPRSFDVTRQAPVPGWNVAFGEDALNPGLDVAERCPVDALEVALR